MIRRKLGKPILVSDRWLRVGTVFKIIACVAFVAACGGGLGSAVQAAPTVSSVSGPLAQGSQVLITGSGFGSKSTPTPQIFDNFESGIIGGIIRGKSPTVGVTWDDYGGVPVYSDTKTRTNSSRSSKHHFAGSQYNTSLEMFPSLTNTGDEIYITFYSYYDKTSTAWSRNYKPFILYGSASDDPKAYIGMGNPALGDGVLRNNVIDGAGSTDSTLWGNVGADTVEGQWVRYEVFLKQSGDNANNGVFQYWVHLPDDASPRISLQGSDTSYITRTSANYWRQLHLGSYYSTDTDSPTADVYLDDVYIDNTRARVEIGDAATWDACTHREIQIPTEWNASAITLDFKQGTFSTNDTVYMYVVDAQGQVNSQGYELTIGAGGPVGRVFFDDFEDGTTDKWENTGAIVTNTQPHGGSFAARGNWNGEVLWSDPAAIDGLKLGSWPYAQEFFVRFWLRRDPDMDTTPGAKYFRLPFTGDKDGNGMIYSDDGNGNAHISFAISGTPTVRSLWNCGSLIDNQWHKIEIYIKDATDGVFKFWFDDELVTGYNSSGLLLPYYGNTHVSSAGWDNWYWISNWSNNPGWEHDADNHTYLDDVEIYSDVGTGTPATGTLEDGDVAVAGGAQYTLTIDTVGTGTGTVEIDPPGGTYDEDTVVELTATADAGSVFAGWSGDLTGSASPETITMNANRAVTATFEETEPPPDNGDRIIDFNDTSPFNSNTALPSPYTEDGYSVSPVAGTPYLTDHDKYSELANFDDDVLFLYDDGTSVQVARTDGQPFAAKSLVIGNVYEPTGGASSDLHLTGHLVGGGTVEIALTCLLGSNTTVTLPASFGNITNLVITGTPDGKNPVLDDLTLGAIGSAPEQFTLTVATDGTGAGSVTLDPAGGTYDADTVVMLTATADAGSVFASWSGDASGTDSTTSVTMSADRNVTVVFDLEILDTDGDGIPDATDPDDDNDGMPDTWETANGLAPADPADGTLDVDSDGAQNLSEYVAGTDPKDANSVLKITAIVKADPGVVVKFDSVTGRLYTLEYTDDPASGTWTVLQADIPGTGGVVETADPDLAGKRLYRLKAKMP